MLADAGLLDMAYLTTVKTPCSPEWALGCIWAVIVSVFGLNF